MALLLSPGTQTQETDDTLTTAAVSTSVGAFAGPFNWGPVMQITPITSQTQLVSTFSEPDNNTADAFFTAYNFLSYSNAIDVVRAQTANQINAYGPFSNTATGLRIDNESVYFNSYYPTEQANVAFCARYPGAMGNSLEVIVFANGAAWTANVANSADPYYTFANYFSWAPATTPWASQVSNGVVTNDEIHVIVVDALGYFTGTANTVLEHYQGLSKLSDALNPTGGTNYYKEVLWQQSSYVYQLGVPSVNIAGWGASISTNPSFTADQNANVSVFVGGNNGSTVLGDYENAYSLFSSTENVSVSLMMTGTPNTSLQSYVIDLVENRRDCVAFCSPPLLAVQSGTSPAAAILSAVSSVTRSSYAFFDSGYKYQYDPYNDVYRWVPLNGDIAGLCARTDFTNAPWWSPAGLQRGVLNNVVKLAYNPGQNDRNLLFQGAINPVVTFPGKGTLLYGDATFLNYSSAFDAINVRRLFIVLEQTIQQAAQAQMFGFNDAFTQAAFVNMITPFLRTVQGQRGITAFQVVCDGTNNTADVVNADQFVASIYIVPNHAIRYITLSFIASPAGVVFTTTPA
jgi:phage tail sheath protein FI